MITKSEFRVQRIQATAFTHDEEQLRTGVALAFALSKWADIYDAEPVSLPLPTDAPEEIPIVVLGSQDGVSRLEISRGRVNIIQQGSSDSARDNVRTFLSACSEKLFALTSAQNIRIGRLATVIIRDTSAENPGLLLAKQFCKEEWINGPLNRPAGFEIHAHKVFELEENLRVNSWMRIKTAPDSGGDYKLIRVEQDINGLSDQRQTRIFSAQQTAAFFAAATEQLDTIMSLYFPDVTGR